MDPWMFCLAERYRKKSAPEEVAAMEAIQSLKAAQMEKTTIPLAGPSL